MERFCWWVENGERLPVTGDALSPPTVRTFLSYARGSGIAGVGQETLTNPQSLKRGQRRSVRVTTACAPLQSASDRLTLEIAYGFQLGLA